MNFRLLFDQIASMSPFSRRASTAEAVQTAALPDKPMPPALSGTPGPQEIKRVPAPISAEQCEEIRLRARTNTPETCVDGDKLLKAISPEAFAAVGAFIKASKSNFVDRAVASIMSRAAWPLFADRDVFTAHAKRAAESMKGGRPDNACTAGFVELLKVYEAIQAHFWNSPAAGNCDIEEVDNEAHHFVVTHLRNIARNLLVDEGKLPESARVKVPVIAKATVAPSPAPVAKPAPVTPPVAAKVTPAPVHAQVVAPAPVISSNPKELTAEQFRGLPHSERNQFFRNGGKIVKPAQPDLSALTGLERTQVAVQFQRDGKLSAYNERLLALRKSQQKTK